MRFESCEDGAEDSRGREIVDTVAEDYGVVFGAGVGIEVGEGVDGEVE